MNNPLADRCNSEALDKNFPVCGENLNYPRIADISKF